MNESKISIALFLEPLVKNLVLKEDISLFKKKGLWTVIFPKNQDFEKYSPEKFALKIFPVIKQLKLWKKYA